MVGLSSGSDQVGPVQVFSFLGLLFLKFAARLQVLRRPPAVRELLVSETKEFGPFCRFCVFPTQRFHTGIFCLCIQPAAVLCL